jgi:hypothetical protein
VTFVPDPFPEIIPLTLLMPERNFILTGGVLWVLDQQLVIRESQFNAFRKNEGGQHAIPIHPTDFFAWDSAPGRAIELSDDCPGRWDHHSRSTYL